MLSDICVKIGLYNAHFRMQFVSNTVYQSIKREVHEEHNTMYTKRLQTCLTCLRYHIWEDGVPVKRRQQHMFNENDIFKFRGI